MSNDKSQVLKAKVLKAEIPELYRGISKIYDIWANITESKTRKRSVKLADIKNGESILEVAVGTGLTFQEILKKNPSGNNQGIDITDEMLSRAKSRIEKFGASNYNLKVGDAYALEFPDNTFDLIMNNYMFDLLPEEDFVDVLSEFKRVLKPDGRIILVNMTKGVHWYNYIWELIYKIKPQLVGGCRGVLLSSYMEKAGFKVTGREFISQATFPSEIISAVKQN